MQRRALHADEFGRARDIAAEAADLCHQIFAFEHLARIAQRSIRCVSTLAVETVGTWPEVRSVCRMGERLEIVTDAAEAVVRQLLFEDQALQELEVRRAGLAEAFVELTREAA